MTVRLLYKHQELHDTKFSLKTQRRYPETNSSLAQEGVVNAVSAFQKNADCWIHLCSLYCKELFSTLNWIYIFAIVWYLVYSCWDKMPSFSRILLRGSWQKLSILWLMLPSFIPKLWTKEVTTSFVHVKQVITSYWMNLLRMWCYVCEYIL